MTRETASGVAVASVAVAVTTVFFIDFCNAVFHCGCGHLWAAAADTCNIHLANSRHCPWCSLPQPLMHGVYFVIILPQIAAAFRPSRWHWVSRLAFTLILFPAIGGLEALAAGWAAGYWN